MNDTPKPHPRNVEGDFYVEDGCCTACMVPEAYAPDLMGFDETDGHCFIARQPTNEDELYRTIKMTWAAELECIRYRGENPQILRRLAEAGLVSSYDRKHLVQGIEPLFRNHVIFVNPQIQSELEIARQFKKYILSQSDGRLKVTKIKTDKSGVSFSYSWYEKNYHAVWFNRINFKDTWHIFHSTDYEKAGSKAVSLQIDEWLRTTKEVAHIKWCTNTSWNKSLTEWQDTPL